MIDAAIRLTWRITDRLLDLAVRIEQWGAPPADCARSRACTSDHCRAGD